MDIEIQILALEEWLGRLSSKDRIVAIKDINRRITDRYRCNFRDGDVENRCKNQVDSGDYCQKHKSLLCKNCGGQATHCCRAGTFGVVCGSPLCDGCVHGKIEDKDGIFISDHIKECRP